MQALEYYVLTIAIYSALNGIAALGLNMQFGVAGILNLAYIVLVAVGAYATGIAALGPAPAGGIVTYLGGFQWPFPIDLLFGIAVTVVFASALSLLVFSRITQWYLALTLSAIGYALLVLAANDPAIVNGESGLIGIPGPFQDQLDPSAYQYAFLGIAALALLLVYVTFTRVENSPLGRALKAVREDEVAAKSLGKSATRLKGVAFLLGATAAGLSGGLQALYFGGWNTDSWLSGETFILLAAVIIGGRGWSRGAFLGSVIVMSVIAEGSRFLPEIGGRTDLVPALQSLLVSCLLLGVLWLRPFGLWPERKESFPPLPGRRAGGERGRAPAPALAESEVKA